MSRPGGVTVKPWLQFLIFFEFYIAAWPDKLLAAQLTSSHVGEDDIWSWCVSSTAEKTFCDRMTRILAAIDPNKGHIHTCMLVAGEGEDGCAQMVAAGQAKFVVLDGAQIYNANAKLGLIPIRVEVSPSQGTYYGVAVVKKGLCPRSLNDLKGKQSCHTGYGTVAGWILPVTKLIAASVMSIVISGPAQNDVQSVKSFFSRSCATNENPTTSLCSACNVTRGCTTSDAYCGNAGAFRGLVEGSCDVAFTKHTIPALYAKGGANADSSWRELAYLSNYQILCPKQLAGQQWCTDPSNFKSCNWGSAPGHTVMTDPRWPAIKLREFNQVLDSANNSSEFRDLLFLGKNRAGILFSPDTVRLDAYTGNTTSRLGPLYNDIQTLERINAARSTSKAISPAHAAVSPEASSSQSLPSPGVSPLLIGGIIAGGILVLLVTGGVLLYLCRKSRAPQILNLPLSPSFRYHEDVSPRHLQSEDSTRGSDGMQSIASGELQVLTDVEGLPKGDGPHIFSWHTLKVATDNFHPRNGLGQGGSGAVYKGILSDGVTVAVKQLSTSSGHGTEELMTQVLLITESSHENLVKLYGYCLEGHERWLVYEYLEKGSLHDALFGEVTTQQALTWPARFKIILGTARGLTYLHHRKGGIVHGNIKASNILLDRDLSPKISDSCLAKLIIGDETQLRVAGTFGYIAREHVLSGHLTEQTDVFSFGILMLETFCGRPIVDPELPSSEEMALLSWTWQLYEAGKILEALDPRLREEEDLPHEEVHKVVKVALLCTQSAASQMRPTIEVVLSMLVGETPITSIPIRPDYLHRSPSSAILPTTTYWNNVPK